MRKILFVMALCAAFAARAQYTPEETMMEPHLLKGSIISPGVEYEVGIGRFSSLNAFVGLNPSFTYLAEEDFYYFLNIAANLQYRYYYSMRNRALNNKWTDNNTGNFLAVHLAAAERSLLTNSDMGLGGSYGGGLVWGLQRTYHSGWYLAAYAGPGVRIVPSGDTRFAPIVGIRFGYTFIRHKSQAVRYKNLEDED